MKNQSESENVTRIVIPVIVAKAENSPVAAHFGKAPYFAVVEVNADKDLTNITIEPNNSEPVGGTEDLEGTLLELKPDVIIANFMGPGIADTFRSAGIQILQAHGATVTGNLANYKQGSLHDLVANCPGQP
jgi:predicted Fe-Mo cluster-binding NifX family protein